MSARLSLPQVAPVRTTCPYCGVGCGVVAQVGEGGKIDISGDPRHPANFGRLCSKGVNLADTLQGDGRLLHPRVNGMRVPWSDALDEAAAGFRRVLDEHGPEAVAFYVSGQLLTEDYYVANKLIKGFMGSANIEANSRLCMASAVAGYKRALGSDTVPTSYEDLERADLVVLTGSNTAWCHPIVFQRILAARKADPTKRLVVIDPRRTSTSEEADLHLAIKPGTDVTLFCGLLDHLRRNGAIDYEFLEQSVQGFGPTFRAAQESAPSTAIVARACGLDEAELLRFYKWFAESERTVSAYSMGVNQSSDGSDKVSAIINCHLATGRIAKPGCGPFSLTGQPNAMGGREVGALANLLAAHLELGDPEDTELLGRFWGTTTIATGPGKKAVEMFEAVERGDIKAIWIMATNPVVSMPKALQVRRALERCDHVVVSEVFEEVDTLDYAKVVLPARPWGEKEGSVTNSERRVSRTRAFLPPQGEAMPDWWIVCEVAKRLGFAEAFAFESAHEIFDEHARLSTFENEGARHFNLGELVGLGAEAYAELDPVRWPVAQVEEPFCDGRFNTPGGKARLIPVRPAPPAVAPSDAYPLVLNTGRIRDQWHTMTRTSRSAALSAHTAEPIAEVHPRDAQELDLEHNQLVRVQTADDEMVARVQITDWQRPGCVFVPMHWTRKLASRGCVNDVTHSRVCATSGQPDFKRTPVRLRPFKAAWHGFLLSRRELDPSELEYWVKVRGEGHWRYELASERPIENPGEWARALLCTESEDGEWVEYADPRRARYRALRLVGEELESCLFMAPDLRLPSRDWLGQRFGPGGLDGVAPSQVLAGRPGQGAALDGSLICSCFKVSMGSLVEAVHRLGLGTCEAVGEATGAGTGCGSCRSEIRALLRQVAPNANNERRERVAATQPPGSLLALGGTKR